MTIMFIENHESLPAAGGLTDDCNNKLIFEYFLNQIKSTGN